MSVLPFGRRWDGEELAALADLTADIVRASLANLTFERNSAEGIAAGGLINRLIGEQSKQELELMLTLIVGMLASEITQRARERQTSPFELTGNLRAALYHGMLTLLGHQDGTP